MDLGDEANTNPIGSEDESLEVTEVTEVTEEASDTNKRKGGKPPSWVFEEKHFIKDDKQSHFIDENWNIQKLILSFKLVPAPHTGITISNTFLKCLDDWNITSRVGIIVH
ncbi:5335_t:CDS:2 [Cetraspora pellucida]|uniref:5335_t:CDS:1 n=1 Tax=Cetraspora pellucida TaxID=1433469 RepID=A0ACA9L3J5_9GLOM|nr:5335_t:CDS:2 [Cetraspora pellucida]